VAVDERLALALRLVMFDQVSADFFRGWHVGMGYIPSFFGTEDASGLIRLIAPVSAHRLPRRVGTRTKMAPHALAVGDSLVVRGASSGVRRAGH